MTWDRTMGFITAVKTCLRKYATFAGTAPRSEYWYFILFTGLIRIAATIVDQIWLAPEITPEFHPEGPVRLATALLIALPFAAVQVRRLNDCEESWAWALLLTGPILINVALMAMQGDARTLALV